MLFLRVIAQARYSSSLMQPPAQIGSTGIAEPGGRESDGKMATPIAEPDRASPAPSNEEIRSAEFRAVSAAVIAAAGHNAVAPGWARAVPPETALAALPPWLAGRLSSRRRAWFFAVIVLLLLVSTMNYKSIPYWSFWGLDFYGIYTYQRCAAGTDIASHPYRGNAALCGEFSGREYNHPPLAYVPMTWTRLFSFATAIRIWATIIAVALVAVVFLWVPRERRRWPVWLVVALLLPQLPAVFAMERGNDDILVVLIWSFAAWFFAKRQDFLAGFAMGAAALVKIYPAFSACAVLAGALLGCFRPQFDRRRFARMLRLVAGFVAGIAFFFAILWHDSAEFFLQQLPGMVNTTGAFYEGASHSLPSVFGANNANPAMISLGLLVLWALADSAILFRDPLLAFAGSLAFSTYFAGISYDYNLITVYPLFYVLAGRVFSRRDGVLGIESKALFFGLFAMVGPRGLFINSWIHATLFSVLIQVVFLAWLAYELARKDWRTA